MSRREVIDCDRCGAKALPVPVQVRVVTGRSPDPAGGSSEDDVELLDLCSPCAAWAFSQVAKKISWEAAAALVKEIRLTRRKSEAPNANPK